MRDEPKPLNEQEERWLDALLKAEGSQASPEPSDSTGELEEFLAAAKHELREVPEADWSAVREGGLVGRVLAATTREDLSWRGELRLVAGYLKERLRSSVALRVVAASLVLHLAAVPVVALWVGRQEPKQPRLEFEVQLPASDALSDPLVEESELEPSSLAPAGVQGPAAIDNARRRARYVLSRAKGPVLPEPTPGDSLERKLLIGRSAYLQDRSWQPWWNETNLWSSASPLARVLWVELLLDAYVLEDQSSTELGLFLAEIDAVASAARGSSPLLGLQESVLQRAQGYGLRPAQAGFDATRLVQPLGADWLTQLRAAAAGTSLEELLGDDAFGAWIAR